MKIEKLSENQIRCFIDKSDLDRYRVNMGELAYGSPKTRALFSEMMQRAMTEHGFNAGNFPLMIEAIPLSAESLQVLVTKVDDPDELDTRFSSFSPESEDTSDISAETQEQAADELLSLFKKFKELSDKQPEHGAKVPALTRSAAYSFTRLDDIITIARTVGTGKVPATSLYKDDKTYYLLMDNLSIDPAYAHLFSLIKEYATKETVSVAIKNYLDEHCDLIIENNALKELALY